MQSDNIAQYMDNTGSFVPQYQSAPQNVGNQPPQAFEMKGYPTNQGNFEIKNAADVKKPSIFSRVTELVKKQPGIVVGIICALVILLIGIIIYYRGIGPVGPAAAYVPCKTKKSAKVIKPVVEPGAPVQANQNADMHTPVPETKQQKSNFNAEIDNLIDEIEKKQ